MAPQQAAPASTAVRRYPDENADTVPPVQSRTVLQHPRTYWGTRPGLGCAALID